MASLFAIQNQITELESLLEQYHEAEDGEIEKQLWDFLFKADEDFNTKAERYAGLIGELEARAKARKEESQRVAHLAQVDQNQSERLKNTLKRAFIERNLTKIETTRYKISLVNNGGKQPLQVAEFDDAKIPDEFKRVQTVLDSDKIRAALEGGEVLEFAQLLPRGKRLAIK